MTRDTHDRRVLPGHDVAELALGAAVLEHEPRAPGCEWTVPERIAAMSFHTVIVADSPHVSAAFELAGSLIGAFSAGTRMRTRRVRRSGGTVSRGER